MISKRTSVGLDVHARSVVRFALDAVRAAYDDLPRLGEDSADSYGALTSGDRVTRP